MNRIPVSEAQEILSELAETLSGWSRRLETIAEGVPSPRFAPGTDEPLNVAAAVQSLVASMLRDELPALETIARTAASLSEHEVPRWRASPPDGLSS